jgi:pimeloyl-ACP methyl ester carboxylesterase
VSGAEPDGIDRDVRLRDGRTLAYSEWGDPAGRPVLFFHGTPGSRLLSPDALVPGTSASVGVRLITIDRPGFGRSDPQPGRTLLDWADDVTELAEALDLKRFAVVGWSDGGPHALACAATIAPRLTVVGVLASRGPLDEVPGAWEVLDPDRRELLNLARSYPGRALGQIAERNRWIIERPESVLRAPWPEADAWLFESAERRVAFIEGIRETARQGLDGYAWDEIACRGPWEFALGEINIEVKVWHGEQDIIVAAANGRYLAEAIPNCRATFWPQDGHLSVIAQRWREILADLQPVEHS